MKRSLVFGLMCSMVFAVACGDDDGGGGGIDAGGGGADSGGGADADPTAPDAAPQVCTAEFAGCEEGDFVVVDSIEAKPVQVALEGFAYVPQCLRVKAGQAVILPANAAASHPLASGSCGAPWLGENEGAGSNVTITMETVGVFGYECGIHGFNGVVEVVP